MTNLGKILKACRKFNRMTQAQLGEKLGITRPYISKIESGNKVPTMQLLQKYSQVFDLEVSAILFLAEQNDVGSVKGKAKSFFRKAVLDFLEYVQGIK